jgi:DNA-binding Lrp family transcriptional regulator
VSDIEDEAILRLAGRLVLDHVTVARFGFDLLDALVMMTVTHANVQTITRDADLQRRYATYEQLPPDHMRRPISINAVAQSLGLPFETVRRRVTKMLVLRVFKSTEHGIITRMPIVANRQHRKALESGYVRARAFNAELDRNGWSEACDEATVWRGDEPLRLVGRIATDYLLRLVHLLMEETGGPLSATVWLAIFCDNVAVDDRGAARAIADEQRPMKVTALARRLRLPLETVRRHIRALVQDGLCVQSGTTVVVDRDVLARPGVQRLLSRNRQDVRRMFATLAEYGVVQSWREAAQPALAAA